jgi:hypothetical protein
MNHSEKNYHEQKKNDSKKTITKRFESASHSFTSEMDDDNYTVDDIKFHSFSKSRKV